MENNKIIEYCCLGVFLESKMEGRKLTQEELELFFEEEEKLTEEEEEALYHAETGDEMTLADIALNTNDNSS